MCLAVEYGKVMTMTIGKIREDFSKLKKLMSEYDLKVNNIYHEIETKNLNAAEGYKKYKELQEVLRQRRVVKHEFGSIQALLTSLDINEIETKIHKNLKSTKRFDQSNKQYRDGWNVNIDDILRV